MRQEYLHVTDDDLLLHAEREVPPVSRDRICAHLESCPECRARLTDLENTLAEFGNAHRENWKDALPDSNNQRVLLRVRLAKLAAQEREKGWLRWTRTAIIERRQMVAFAGIAIAVCSLLAVRLHIPAERSPLSASLRRSEKPDLRLTPGATVPVTETEVCGEAARKAPLIPLSLKQRVFEEYGITPQPDAYEVDYLITPELGGATDIRNLWPQPYHDTVWNAHVKDQLEDRLHRMVCRGDLDLATAQREIATDWIAAYRKYFHADRPVEDGFSFNFSTYSLPRS